MKDNDIRKQLEQAIKDAKRLGVLQAADTPKIEFIGWICPVCGRGMSPWAHSCPCAKGARITVNTSTSYKDS